MKRFFVGGAITLASLISLVIFAMQKETSQLDAIWEDNPWQAIKAYQD